MSESDFGRKTTGGRRGTRHTTTEKTGEHAGHGHGQTHTKHKQTHGDPKQTRHNERKDEMKGKTLAALIGMLFGTFLFLGQTSFAAPRTVNTFGAGGNDFAIAATTGGTPDSFTTGTRGGFNTVTFTRGGTYSTDFGGFTNSSTADSTETNTTTTEFDTTGRVAFEFATAGFGTATGTNTFGGSEDTFAGTVIALGGSVGDFADGGEQGFFNGTRF